MAKLSTWPSAREPDGCKLMLTQAFPYQDEPSPSAGSKFFFFFAIVSGSVV